MPVLQRLKYHKQLVVEKIQNATVDVWSSWCLILIFNLRSKTNDQINLIKQRQQQNAVGGLYYCCATDLRSEFSVRWCESWPVVLIVG